MKTVVKALDKLSHYTYKLGVVLTLICMGGIVACIALSVGFRFLATPLLWVDELSRLLMVAGTFIAGSVGLKKGQLVRFDFLINLTKGRGNSLWYLLTDLLTLAFLYLFLSNGLEALPMYNKSISMTLPITLVWPAAGMVLGGLMMFIHAVDLTAQDLFKLFNGDQAEAPQAITEGVEN